MKHQLNEVFVKMTSLVAFPKEIELGEDVTVTIAGQNYCVKQEVRDKQDERTPRSSGWLKNIIRGACLTIHLVKT